MTSIIVMMLVSMLGISYIALTTTNLVRAGRDERRATAFHLAEAGLDYMIEKIISEAQTNGGTIVAKVNYNSTPILSELVSGATGVINVVPDAGLNTYATITSSATYRGITETIRVRVKIRSVGVWDNAIFAGIGQSGRGINGNVDIRGSVHILGDGEPFSDLNGNGQWDSAETFTDDNGNGKYDAGEPFVDADGNGIWSDAEPFQDNNLNGVYDQPLTVTDLAGDLSGRAFIGNNYAGMPVLLQSKIPPLTPEPVAGEMVYTLNAEVRVKHGRINLSGTATIGNPNIFGNSVKETIDGTYVSDGWGGTAGAANVYSDNGSSQRYDLGDRVSFPSLLDPYTDPNTGISYTTYADYLRAKSLTIPINKIDSTVPAFSFSDGTNSISWDPISRRLNITGIVRINGNLDLSRKDGVVIFDGKGTLFVENDIMVHGSVLPLGTFPTTSALGCIAGRDINFATGIGEAQLYAAGAWFAQRKIVSAKQSQFAGTYVANYFDMGTNVPDIYQVPALSRNLPPGMPGGDIRIVTAQILSWRRL
ncbi:MAG: hypothetical protein QHH26_08760 [Armatimonadota bacterium]|nr:hypothetical protein [Armatimonadota bacterium]